MSADNLNTSVAEIEERITLIGPLSTFEAYRDEIRVLLSHKFLSLDDGLKESLEKVKFDVAKVLIEKGCLCVLKDHVPLEPEVSALDDEIQKLDNKVRDLDDEVRAVNNEIRALNSAVLDFAVCCKNTDGFEIIQS